MQFPDAGIPLTREEAEDQTAVLAAKTSYTERFYMLMKLIRLSDKIRNAKVVSSPALPENLC